MSNSHKKKKKKKKVDSADLSFTEDIEELARDKASGAEDATPAFKEANGRELGPPQRTETIEESSESTAPAALIDVETGRETEEFVVDPERLEF